MSDCFLCSGAPYETPPSSSFRIFDASLQPDAIEASPDEMDYEIIVPKIEAGTCYEIINFRTNKTRFGRVSFRLFPGTDSPCKIIIGCTLEILTVQRLEPIQINHIIDYKCDLVIQNIRNEEVKITLWLDVAHSFSSVSFEQLPQPIVSQVQFYISLLPKHC
ncbi:hypothetical protein DVH24_009902 [Malus domestica]|uniref:Uncharacterized protein n=1 Tax=Malus domestica TaxID=3750 RepID=A0A498JRN7_MALDO|nr:hypothetical protein DVH24_009902 [Malus domestica]